LAENVFCDSSALNQLNRLLHPLVKKRIKQEIRKWAGFKKNSLVVVEVPLLFETGFDRIFDVNVVVAAGPAVQKKRMLKDGRFSKVDLRLRSRFQMPLAAKTKACDFVIDNTRDKNNTLKQVKMLVELLGKKPKEFEGAPALTRQTRSRRMRLWKSSK
jgi:dephospho-CoA kinase